MHGHPNSMCLTLANWFLLTGPCSQDVSGRRNVSSPGSSLNEANPTHDSSKETKCGKHEWSENGYGYKWQL